MPNAMLFRSLLMTLACALLLGAGARANETRKVDVPAGELTAALQALAKQAGLEFVYSVQELKGIRTNGVRGEYTPQEAVTRLLEGTNLTLTVHETGALLIAPPPLNPLSSNEANGWSARREGEGSFSVERGEEPIRGDGKVSVAQGPVTPEGGKMTDTEVAEGGATKAGEPAGNAQSTSGEMLDEIIVTGSRLPAVGDGAFQVNVYTREEIDRSGHATLNGFLSTLNEISVTSPQGLGAQFGGQTAPQLRGLPIGTTLTLINGRRVQTSGSSLDGSFFNLDVIPFAAIERIEILPVGSSAVYGGDALAGVLNIVLKGSENAFAVNGRHGTADGADDTDASVYLGRDFDRGSFSLIGSYSDHSPLSARERAFFRDADYTRYGGRDARVRTCIPGTVNSTTSDNLPGLNANVAAIPAIASGGTPTVEDFVPTAGTSTLCASAAQGDGFALVAGSEQTSVHASGDLRVAGSVAVFGELTYSETSADQISIPPSLSNALVPAGNPFNPFGADVRVTTRLGTASGLSLGSELDSEFSRYLVGVRGDLAGSWDFEAAASRVGDQSRLLSHSAVVDTAARAAALAASDPNTALNPFTTGRAAPDAVLRSIWSDRVTRGEGTKEMFSGFVRGSLFSLPAGSADAVIGLEHGRDELRFDVTPPDPSYDLAREYRSAFVETRLPLLDRARGGPDALDLATLTLAGRHDDYGAVGDATTYQLGLEVRPVDGLLARFAAATSFKPPTLLQLNPVPQSLDIELFGLVDPANGNAPIVEGTVDFRANDDLQPEEGSAQTIGLLWEPQSGRGPRVGITAWRLAIEDNIIFPDSPQLFLDNEALFPGFVTRAPPTGGGPGAVTSIVWTHLNFGKVNVSGFDLDLGYTLETPIGAWIVGASATRTHEYEVELTPNAPAEDHVDKLFSQGWAPQWKGKLDVRLDAGAWSFGATGRYLGEYEDAGSSVRELGDIWYIDLSAQLDVEGLFPGGKWAEGISLAANVINATDELPDYAETPFFYDTSQGDWTGRYISLRLNVSRGE